MITVNIPAVSYAIGAVAFLVLSLLLLTAMACGMPTVATCTGGSTELLTDGENALVFEAENAEHLAARIKLLVEDSGLRKRLSRISIPEQSLSLRYYFLVVKR